MRAGLARTILLYFGLLLIITISNFAILLNEEDDMREQYHWVQHTHQVIGESEKFLGHMRDAETGQRGFLLTLNQEYLKPFNDGIEGAYSNLKLLKNLTKDNAQQQTRHGLIVTLMNQKISELEKTIQLAKQDNLTEAMAIVNSDKGKIIMDDIRNHINVFIYEEERLLKQRADIHLDHIKNLRIFFILETILSIFIIAIVAGVIQRIIVRPLIIMKKSIAQDDDFSEIEIIAKTEHNEIGVLAETFSKMNQDVKQRTKEKDNLISDLQSALNEIEALKGIIPICSYCHKIRDDEGAWNQLEIYLSNHSGAQFSHGICPTCMIKAQADTKASLDNNEG